MIDSIIEVIRSFFGTYTPITYLDLEGNEIIPSGVAGVNFEYVFAMLIFLVAFYSFFRLLGTFISKR